MFRASHLDGAVSPDQCKGRVHCPELAHNAHIDPILHVLVEQVPVQVYVVALQVARRAYQQCILATL